MGLSEATACIAPERRSSGTYTGAKKSRMNTGICISGPAWIERKRMAIPADHMNPQTFTRKAREYRPTRSMGSPETSIPTTRAITVMSAATITQRRNAAIAYPRTIPLRFGEARRSLRAKPPSKSRATPKPVNTPPNAADWSRTKTNWNVV